MTRVLYNCRSRLDPLWNSFIIAGLEGNEKKPYLGSVDLLGVGYTNAYISTGFGRYLCAPVLADLNKRNNGKISQAEALEAVKQCLRLLVYASTDASDKVQLAIVDNTNGVQVSKIQSIDTDWSLTPRIEGYEPKYNVATA